jgi:hypothetical protein
MPVIGTISASAAESSKKVFSKEEVLTLLDKGTRPDVKSFNGMYLTTDELITLMLESLRDEDKKDAYAKVLFSDNTSVKNDAEFRKVVMSAWSKNEKNKSVPLDFGSVEQNPNAFNVYRLVNPRVFTILQERKQKQRERTLITDDMLRNFLLIRGPLDFAGFPGFRGGGSLDPNVPIEMRGRGKSLFGGAAPYTLWEELNPSALASDDLEYQYETAKSILKTKLGDNTKAIIERELIDLKKLEVAAKERSTQFKTILTARANGKLDKEHVFADEGSLKTFADSYNLLIKQLNSKSKKLGNVIRVIVSNADPVAP